MKEILENNFEKKTRHYSIHSLGSKPDHRTCMSVLLTNALLKPAENVPYAFKYVFKVVWQM